MPEVSHDGVNLQYDVIGEGPPLVLMHGWCCDRTWWEHAGFIDALAGDFTLVNMDLRGHGESDKPHEPLAYTTDLAVGDLLAVADAEGLDRFAVWGLSLGGWYGWHAGQARPDRVAALVTSGSWYPRPDTLEDWAEFDASVGSALRTGGTPALIAQFDKDELSAREFMPWAREVTLRADPEALLAIQSRELYTLGQGVTDLDSYPVPALLISGEREDPDDEAAQVAARLPNGESLWLPGLGHPGCCAASALSVPTARAFLDRWYV